MDDIVPAFLVTVTGALLAALQFGRFSRSEVGLLAFSFVAHVGSAVVQIQLTSGLYGGGDLFSYVSMGDSIAAVLRVNFAQFAPEVLKILLHQEGFLPFEMGGVGSSTAGMGALAGILTFITGGSTYTLCILVAVGAYFGKVALYRAFCLSFPVTVHRRLLYATMLVPSVVFWSSALLKESVAIAGLGYLVLGMVRVRRTPSLSPVVQIFAGALVIGIAKAYILVPLFIAGAFWLYLDTGRGLTLGRLLLGAAVAFAGILILGRVFPEYALDKVAEQTASFQSAGQSVRGASSYSLGDPSQMTLTGQLTYAPLALATSLFRPLLIEVNSVQVAVNALESTAILFLALWTLFRKRETSLVTQLLQSPMMVFSAAFTTLFGIAVGLATTNLGALSRYRMPLLPFFVGMMLVLNSPAYVGQMAPAARLPNPLGGRKFPLGAPRSSVGR